MTPQPVEMQDLWGLKLVQFEGVGVLFTKIENKDTLLLEIQQKWWKSLSGRRQDGRVEGFEFTSCYENTNHKWPLDNHWQKRLGPTRNDILCPKTKDKPQQDDRKGASEI